ncbi:lactonase family protein [Oerskovia turbata]|uniref:Lactonase family protein n=1 Tax=Oerskovia turbata TaxID=1713 RepID=A0A4Q1L314_9CELL|nr:beta-propeller fold lactonase family protein [Oerskovia turbata]RXR26985.1 lactonase family protein [Oerskovia turbata]RXR36172.1 lactonase family protein [Oerskovia turbata]TGJ95394.1 lactonase family protein [Actinotalea fermentans ATCC 43279 = JCM 9966 = DSM 3133]
MTSISTSSVASAPDSRTLWLGTYPDGAAPGSGEGIWRLSVDASTGELGDPVLAAVSPSPSFVALAPGGERLYAVSETEQGTVSGFEVTPDGGLAPSGTALSGGTYPCHLVATDDAVRVANYGDGTFAVLPLDASGVPTAPLRLGHRGAGPDAARQEGPHAHFVAEVAGEPVVVDLGTDELRAYPRSLVDVRSLAEGPDGAGPARVAATFPAGAGPRHLAVLEDGRGVPAALFVATELDARVYVLVPSSEGSFEVAASVEATAAPVPVGGRNYPSHVALSEDGSRLFVAIRGADVLSTFAVSRTSAGPDGAAPVLEHLADSPLGGAWPRHFAVLAPAGQGSPEADLVVVANQNSSNLTVLRIDRADGAGTLVDEVAIPVPACVVEA